MRTKLSLRALVYTGCAVFALTTAFAQNVEVRRDSKDSKSVPITQEVEPSVLFLLETGYTSEYNFRGTNLMPGAIGAYFYQAAATIPKAGPGSLTLGVYVIHQIGTAQAHSWSISEGGGGGGVAGDVSPGTDINGNPIVLPYTRFPTTTQTAFHEVDLVSSYKMSFGFLDVTLGNIAFLIHREATTSEIAQAAPGFVWANPPTFTPFTTFAPLPTVGDEQFDRLYIRLSTAKIPHVIPSIIYYQTIYNNGNQPEHPGEFILTKTEFGDKISVMSPGLERNEELGGYLEGRLNGNFPVGNWLDINPFAVAAFSFRDRTEPAPGTFSGRPFTGFNHVQVGVEFAFHIAPHVELVPQATYSHHISTPPIGTDRNEFWAGIRLAVNF